jgi:Bacterial protein of unknown function (Gcw_chp)
MDRAQRGWMVAAACVAFSWSASSAAQGGAPTRDVPSTPVPPPEVSSQVETLLATTYVFRGVPQYSGRSIASSQSTVSLAMKNLGPGDLALTAWNATALAPTRQQPTTSLEVDLTAAYSIVVARSLTASAGYIAYLYPRATPRDGAHEVFGQMVFEGVVSPGVAVFAEVVRLRGAYATAFVGKKMESGPVAWTPQISIGIVGYEGIRTHVNDVTASLGAQYAVSRAFYVALRAGYSYLPKPAEFMPDGDGAASARSVPVGAVALGLSL